MLEQLLTYLHNWFRVQDAVDGKHPGTYTVENDSIVLPFLQDGQYFRIIGSIFNDGLYVYGSETIADEDRNEVQLHDETFNGSVWALYTMPKDVFQGAKDLQTIYDKTVELVGNVSIDGFTSESFAGVYSYSKDMAAQIATLKAQRNEILTRLKACYGKYRED